MFNNISPGQKNDYLKPHIWNSVQQNHPYDTLLNFPDKQKKSKACIEMYG